MNEMNKFLTWSCGAHTYTLCTMHYIYSTSIPRAYTHAHVNERREKSESVSCGMRVLTLLIKRASRV